MAQAMVENYEFSTTPIREKKFDIEGTEGHGVMTPNEISWLVNAPDLPLGWRSEPLRGPP